MLDEHFQWSIQQQLNRRNANQVTIQTSQQKRLVRAINKGLPRCIEKVSYIPEMKNCQIDVNKVKSA